MARCEAQFGARTPLCGGRIIRDELCNECEGDSEAFKAEREGGTQHLEPIETRPRAEQRGGAGRQEQCKRGQKHGERFRSRERI